MQKPQLLSLGIIRDKRFLLGSGFVFLLILALYFFFSYVPSRPPDGVLEKAISRTSDAKNFKYNVATTTIINGKKNTFSQVAGEKFRPDNLHIKGEVMKSQIDIYQINEKIYAKDNLGGKWVSIDINELNQDGNFMNELNPLENISFKQLGEVNYKGVIKAKTGKYWEFELRPIVDNQYMEALWTDFVYTIWVHPGEEKLSKVQIKAKGKENENDEIIVNIEFLDYGDVKPVNPPV